jgi:hypothetical protein
VLSVGLSLSLSADKSVARVGDVVTFTVRARSDSAPAPNVLISILIRLEDGYVVRWLVVGYTDGNGVFVGRWEVPERILAVFPAERYYDLAGKTWEIYAYSPPNYFSNIIAITILPRGAPLPTPSPAPTVSVPTPPAVFDWRPLGCSIGFGLLEFILALVGRRVRRF